MKIVALTGVSGSGKTSLVNDLEAKLGKRIKVIPEVTKGEVCTFGNLPLIDHSQATRQQLFQFDVARLEYQLKIESEAISEYKEEIIVFEKSTPIYLMYLLTLSARSLSESHINYFVNEVRNHSSRYYDIMFYLPFNTTTRLKNLERNFTNSFVLTLQDAALCNVIGWLNVSWVKLGFKFRNRVNEVIENLGVAA